MLVWGSVGPEDSPVQLFSPSIAAESGNPNRTWGIWGSYYNVPEAIFYLLKVAIRPNPTMQFFNVQEPPRRKASEGVFDLGRLGLGCSV